MLNLNLKTVIYHRNDLKNIYKKIEDIYISDFNMENNMYTEDLYIFVDDDLTTKILKSRHTDSGIVTDDMKKRGFFRSILQFWNS